MRLTHGFLRSLSFFFFHCFCYALAFSEDLTTKTLGGVRLNQPGIYYFAIPVKAQLSREKLTVIDRGGATPVKPASVMKVVSSWTVAQNLGVDYRFLTEFYIRTSAEAGSELVVKVSADPSLRSEELLVASERIAARLPEGFTFERIVLLSEKAPWLLERSGQRAYEAGFSQAALNFNSILLSTCAREQSTYSYSLPDLSIVQFQGTATISGKAPLSIDELSPWNYRVAGALNKRSGCFEAYRSVPDPERYFVETLRSYLKRFGVKVRGAEYKRVQGPVSGTLLHRHESRPVSLLLFDKNRYSSNFYAGQLIRAVGDFMPGPGTAADRGHQAIAESLRKLAVPQSEFQIVDASGLSHDNRLSARAIVRVLKEFWDDFRLRSDFVSTLAVPGRLGTLESRKYDAFFRAKTGTLRDTRSLAGYLENRKGEIVAFALIQNGSHLLKDALIREEEFIRALRELE